MSTAKDKVFPWSAAHSQALQLESLLLPYCDRILIVGSLRRRKPVVHDIDIVVIPTSGPFTQMELQAYLGACWAWGKGKAKTVSGLWHDFPVDIYFATKETWWTLVVIRTGPRVSNIRLCQRAHDLVAILHADGSGLQLPDNSYYIPKSEEDLFAALKLPYVDPGNR